MELVPACGRPEEVGVLFTEYTDLLLAGDPSFHAYLDVQHYDEELRHLDAKYGPPDGRLYLAYCDGALAGCIGLRKLDSQSCEMKRLYVRPAFGGRGLGGALVDRIIADAQEIGYSHMLLDTFPFLSRAIGMYQKRGFYEIERYNDSPMAAAIYMRLDL